MPEYLNRINSPTTIEVVKAAISQLVDQAKREQALVGPLETSREMWNNASLGTLNAGGDLRSYSSDLVTSWRSRADSSLFSSAVDRSMASLTDASGRMGCGSANSSGGVAVQLGPVILGIQDVGRQGIAVAAQVNDYFADVDSWLRTGGELNATGVATVVENAKKLARPLGMAMDALATTYLTTGDQILTNAQALKWDGPGAGKTVPGGGPGGPGVSPAAGGPAPGGAAGGLGAPAGGPAGAVGDPALASAGPAGGPAAELGAPVGGPAGGPAGGPPGGPAGALGGPAGAPGGTELSRLSPGGVPPVPTPPGGLPGGLTPPALPNGGLPLPPTGLAPLPPIGSAVNGVGASNNRPRLPGANPLPPVGRGGLGTIGSGGLGSNGINGSAGIGGLRGSGGGELRLGNLRGGGGDLGLGKTGADIRGDQMIPRASDQSVAPNQAATSRALTGPGSPLGTTVAGAATGGTPGGSPPMMPPMAGAGAGGGGGSGRGGKPGTGAIRPVNRKRKRQNDNTPGVPVGLRGKAGRELPGAFPMLPVNNRRRKDERDKAVDTIELLDEELWKVEEAEAVETKKRVGRLAT